MKDINKIVSCFDSFKDIKGFSKVVSLEEIRENDHNLNIRRYADTSPGTLYNNIVDKFIKANGINSVNFYNRNSKVNF